MGYSLNPAMVRGDLFTPGGKWKYTVVIDMSMYYGTQGSKKSLIHDCVKEAFITTPSHVTGITSGYNLIGSGMTLVVLEPYHKNSHPIAITL